MLALFKQVDVADFIKLEHPKAMLIQLLNDAGLPAPEARYDKKAV